MRTNLLCLTPAQAAFLADRPSECVAECVHDRFPELDEGTVISSVEWVQRHFGYNPLNGTCKPTVIDLALFSRVDTAVLLDFLQGSTVCGQLWDSMGMDRSQALAYGRAKRTCHAIANKFRAAGLNVTFIPDA